MTAAVTTIPTAAMPAVPVPQEQIESDAVWLVSQLRQIERLAPSVGSVTPVPDGHVRPAPGSRPPCSLDRVSIQRELGHVLVFWLTEAADDGLPVTRPDGWTTIGVLISRAIAGAGELSAWRRFDGIADDIASLAGQCHRSAVSVEPRLVLGDCPVKIDAKTAARCGGALVARSSRAIVKCPSCGTVRTVSEWTSAILDVTGGRHVTIPTAVVEVHRRQGVHMSERHLRRLVAESGIEPVGKGPTYRLADILHVVEAYRSRGELVA